MRDLDRNDLLIPATRYYIGRRTIGTCAHAKALAAKWQEIPQNVRNVIRTDLEDAFRRDDSMRADPVCSSTYYPLGDDCDREAWEDVRKAWLREECYCYNCNIDRMDPTGWIPFTLSHMILCPICGNKRCPHATDHKLACTNSNEPGQPGSRYGGLPEQRSGESHG